MKYKVDIKRLLVLAAAAAAVILVAKGCLYAKTSAEECDMGENGEEPNLYISVYDHREDEVITLPLEEYVAGVVAAEMPASYSSEALSAQAVAARTYAVTKLACFGGKPCGSGGQGCDICTDSACCQAWCSDERQREKWGDDYEKYRIKIADAVARCRGEAALYDGKPIEALYHAASGGFTEYSQNVFSQPRPYLVGVESPEEAYVDVVSLGRSEFAKKIEKAFPKSQMRSKRLDDAVEILSRYESGRVDRLRLGDTVVSGRDFRKALGLASTNFKIDIDRDSVTVKTMGFGHGVGMSQRGANAMALEGADYVEILMHYYKGIEVADLSVLINY